jgi:hypothetical protein
MTTLSKTYLTVAVTGLGMGGILEFNGFKLNPAWTVAPPFGAMACGICCLCISEKKWRTLTKRKD